MLRKISSSKSRISALGSSLIKRDLHDQQPAAGQQFRQTFQKITKDRIQWFPGHMGKGLKQMQQKLKQVDCIIEVHDARIPFSGRNPDFNGTVIGVRPHILVLNKKDLIDRRHMTPIADRIRQEENIEHIIFTNCKDQNCSGLRKILPLARELISGTNRFHRTETYEHCLMVIGVPNVGKSSLLNQLRNRHLGQRSASAVGARAGITRSVLNRIKVCDDPKTYLLDTPGILTPRIGDTETGMRLALCWCLQDHLVGPGLIADYLLYWMNKRERFDYVRYMGLKEPTDDINRVLIEWAFRENQTMTLKTPENKHVTVPDRDKAAMHFINGFRQSHFGRILLDDEFLEELNKEKERL